MVGKTRVPHSYDPRHPRYSVCEFASRRLCDCSEPESQSRNPGIVSSPELQHEAHGHPEHQLMGHASWAPSLGRLRTQTHHLGLNERALMSSFRWDPASLSFPSLSSRYRSSKVSGCHRWVPHRPHVAPCVAPASMQQWPQPTGIPKRTRCVGHGFRQPLIGSASWEKLPLTTRRMTSWDRSFHGFIGQIASS